MRAATLLILTLPLLGFGCDQTWAESQADGVTASSQTARPDGWKSLDGDDSALRLYYQFTDSSRKVRFVERLEDVPESMRAGVGFVKLAVAPPLSPGDAVRARKQLTGGAPRASTAAHGTARVVLYAAPWCGASRKAKQYLAHHGIAYEERDVNDPRNADELVRKSGGRTIPVLEVDGRVLTGFSERGYADLLGRA